MEGVRNRPVAARQGESPARQAWTFTRLAALAWGQARQWGILVEWRSGRLPEH